MKETLTWKVSNREPRFLFWKAFGVALVLELVLLTCLSLKEHWLAHPPVHRDFDESRYIEASVFELPQNAKLVSEAESTSTQKEKTISLKKKKNPQDKRKSHPNEDAPLSNQTEKGSDFPADHGAIALHTPAPRIPDYLRNETFHSEVLIDFYVSARGVVTPRLIQASGNEEIDAIALEAVTQWQFRPAEKEHQAIDSKIRLRIKFDIE